MKISIGLAEPIEVSMGVKCGGAVERPEGMPQGVNSLSISPRMMKKMKKILMETKPNLRIQDAIAARKTATQPKIVTETLI